MGSKCSILNDTEYDVWITHGINWQSLVFAVDILLFVATMGAASGSTVNTNAVKVASVVKDPLENLRRFGMNKPEETKTDTNLAYELIKPGEKYTWFGTLSLHMRVYVKNHKLQLDENVCFTGPTPDSENVYPISTYFKKLDIKTNK
ncbi:Hypothetical predicted protein [Paramuricea clavata]|uniref:Uncharacterized protein n=1 Tax=Paramuricea clavata TaxID=317549 RepID=A0A6S7J458_PARCT|nr:Hypothetical predicted protein [Paramuricea clavata]